MRSRLAERIRPIEMIEARAAAEAKPLPTRSTPLPPNWGRDMLAFLRSQDAADRAPAAVLAPLPLTDWSARLADDWTHVNARHDNLTAATAREFDRWRVSAEYTSRALVSPVLAEVADLTKVRLPEWRRALVMHAEAELALYGTKAEVA